MPEFPVHDEITVQDGRTVFKDDRWWKAVILYEDFQGLAVAVYVWQNWNGDDWRRQQKYVIRSHEAWEQDRDLIEEFIWEL